MPDPLLYALFAFAAAGVAFTYFFSLDEWRRPWKGKPTVRPRPEPQDPARSPPRPSPPMTITQRQAWAILGLVIFGAAVLMVTFALGGVYWGRMLERDAERTLEIQKENP